MSTMYVELSVPPPLQDGE